MTPFDTRAWVDAYQHAWTSSDPDDIRALFSERARYYTAPFRPPWSGHEEIVAGWLGRRDEPGTWSFRYEVLLESAEISLVRGWTTYHDDERSYSNLWVIRPADDGRCREFVEWWMLEDDSAHEAS
jgi:hypothetical protein